MDLISNSYPRNRKDDDDNNNNNNNNHKGGRDTALEAEAQLYNDNIS